MGTVATTNIVDLFKFTVEKYLGGQPRAKIKKSKLLDMLTTLSYWFGDLTLKDIERIQNEIEIQGTKLFTNVDIHEKSVGEFDEDIDSLFCEEGSVLDPIVFRSYELFRCSHYSVNFGGLHELLKHERSQPEIDHGEGV